MTLEAFSAPMLDAADPVFDFPRGAPARPAVTAALLAAERADPEPGWATRHPERAMLFLFVTPRDGNLVDELLAA